MRFKKNCMADLRKKEQLDAEYLTSLTSIKHFPQNK